MIGITMLKIMRGHDTEVYRFLKDMKYVKEVYHVLGEFPLFVIIQVEDQFTLNRLIDTIKEIPNVTGIWHILVSNDNNPSRSRTGFSEMNGSALG
ncbi:MAG: Lrp/AsnC ligand binding domain-containing protein [Methanothrix sp.]|nr:Lrp/AsnC ligand binding domain-containing protein [Methanothrix sp.]